MSKYLNISEENGLHPLSKDRGIRPDAFIKKKVRYFMKSQNNRQSFFGFREEGNFYIQTLFILIISFGGVAL